MMRLMYDSTDAEKVPINGDLYAGYVDGLWPSYWTLRDRFPDRPVVSITTSADLSAECLDFERGDASLLATVAWCRGRELLGATPLVYAGAGYWNDLRNELELHGQDKPQLWLADPTGRSHMAAGAVATQWAWCGDYDVSAVLDDFDYGTRKDPENMTPSDLQAIADDVVRPLLTDFWNNQTAPALARIEALLQQVAHELGIEPR